MNELSLSMGIDRVVDERVPYRASHAIVPAAAARPVVLATGALALWLMTLAPSTSASTPAAWPVAITIDDLPMSGGADCDGDEVGLINVRLLDTLDAFKAPATAFAVPGTPCQGDGEAAATVVARRWRAAGHDVGNHSHTHPDFNTLAADVYLSDLGRAHDALEPVLAATAQRHRWFRAPMLHTGDSPRKKAALGAWLEQRGYRQGVVTIDNQEWVYAAAYARAQGAGDWHLADRVAEAYVEHVREAASYSRELARRLFGREIPQVLLLHANRLNADRLGDVLHALERDGARWTTLGEALADPAYATPDTYVGPRGLSWLLRWAQVRDLRVGPEPRESAWVARAARAGPSPARDVLPYRTVLELDDRNRLFSTAWLEGDLTALVGAYTETASIQPPPDGVLHGTVAIEQFWRRNLPGRRIAHRLQPTLRQLMGRESVLELGRWHATTDETAGPATGCYTVLWQRGADGVWRMQHDGWRAANAADWACRPRSEL